MGMGFLVDWRRFGIGFNRVLRRIIRREIKNDYVVFGFS